MNNLSLNNKNNISFKGYDVRPLKGLYVQGFCKPEELKIFSELKSIAKQEKFNLVFNQNNTKLSKNIDKQQLQDFDKTLSIWGQDNKAFLINKKKKILLCNSKEKTPPQDKEISDFSVIAKQYAPRGGNYFIGQNKKGEKWLLINSMSITDNQSFKQFGDTPTKKHLTELFEVKNKNIYTLNEFSNDLDEIVRPIKYPYILVNDSNLSLKNLEKMKEKFPDKVETYDYIKNKLDVKIRQENNIPQINSAEDTANKLKKYGFNPIKIAGSYCEDINFLNAIAFENKKGNISYITNSTKHTSPELEYLEELFKNDLKSKIKNVDNIYFISGGKKENTPNKSTENDLFSLVSDRGLPTQNNIMSIFANRHGGIHCMCAEIPE